MATVVQLEGPGVWASLTSCATSGKSLRLPRALSFWCEHGSRGVMGITIIVCGLDPSPGPKRGLGGPGALFEPLAQAPALGALSSDGTVRSPRGATQGVKYKFRRWPPLTHGPSSPTQTCRAGLLFPGRGSSFLLTCLCSWCPLPGVPAQILSV